MAGKWTSTEQKARSTTPFAPTPAKGENQEDPMLEDERSSSCRGWWGCRAAVGVWVLLVAGTLMLLTAAFFLYTYLMHHTFHYPQNGSGVGLLVQDVDHDSDLLRAAYQAAHDTGVMVHVEETKGTPTDIVGAFTRLWEAGVRVFLVGGSQVQSKTLCQHLQQEKIDDVLLVSPIANADPSCPSLLALTPPRSALIAAEVTWVVGVGMTSLIPIVNVEKDWKILQQVVWAVAPRLIVAPPVFLKPGNVSHRELKESLESWPNAAVWLAVDDLTNVMSEAGHHFLGHLVLLHTDPHQANILLQHPGARQVAEECAVVRVGWAGVTRVSAPSRRRLLGTITPQDPLVAALSNDAAFLTMAAATAGLGHNITQLKAKVLTEQSLPRVTYPIDTESEHNSVGGWVVRLRLVRRELLGKIIVQDSPWLLEGESWVEGSGISWLVKENHAPTRLMSRKELQSLTEQAGCFSSARISVTTHDPLTHKAHTTGWTTSAIPKVMLVPNGSPAGFNVQVWCKDGATTPTMEVACRGAASHNDSLQCVTAALKDGQSGKRRVVRSMVSSHYYPVYYYYEPVYQPELGFFDKTYSKIKGFFKHEDFRALIPQLGGCIGTTAGCSFCFVFILLFDVAVNPGVCYGACGVAVGGSCSTLLSRGIQYSMDHTVICSELFQQGRLPLTSYLADASYGSKMVRDHPKALRGYQLLVSPVVAAMQVSSRVSDVVEALAQPWVRHMEYQEGTSSDDNTFGYLITFLGVPFCSFFMLLYDLAPTLVFLILFAMTLHHRSRT
ncbi:hypothetical protein Pcinc_029574 [Petrolisthes cinctipes]|uniref:Uncharacterized protein n=1 Tax=Petrolisthes cinctipes TaxID=88211 RepID=A0AAE1K7A7_PETCI|nr:hypothetical protein Pcinc_029574 [Petrolisthes cinctipes]